MYKKWIFVERKMVDHQMLGLINELENKGFLHDDGFLYYEETDKEYLSKIFSKYGKLFLE